MPKKNWFGQSGITGSLGDTYSIKTNLKDTHAVMILRPRDYNSNRECDHRYLSRVFQGSSNWLVLYRTRLGKLLLSKTKSQNRKFNFDLKELWFLSACSLKT